MNSPTHSKYVYINIQGVMIRPKGQNSATSPGTNIPPSPNTHCLDQKPKTLLINTYIFILYIQRDHTDTNTPTHLDRRVSRSSG